jgi:hypothetical protein
MHKTHYTYLIEEPITKKFYIGSRTCNGSAEDDASYMGSMVVWKPNKIDLKKTILDDTFLSREHAIEVEGKLIKEHIDNPLNQNYNIPGIGFHNTGRIFDTSIRKKMSIARLGEKNPNFGKTHSEETIEKIRRKAIGRKASSELRNKLSSIRIKKPVLQYDKEMNLISEYSSMKDAGIKTNTDKGDISKVCSGKQKSAGGWIWELKK